MRDDLLVAVAVLGEQNLSRISSAHRLPHVVTQVEQALEWASHIVARKQPGRIYYIVEVYERTWKKKPGDPLYVWHVGDGFEHHEGWWVGLS